MFQKLACLIHHHEFTARTQAWINAQYAVGPERWGHEEAAQVPLEHRNRFRIRPFFEGSAYLSLQRWEEQPLVGILAVREQIGDKGRLTLLDYAALHQRQRLRSVNVNPHGQHFFTHPTEDG